LAILMASAFGVLLKRLRERRFPSLSLRQFAQLCDLDHAYIHRLETGEKASPSAETLGSIFRVMKPSPIEERLLRFLVGRDTDLALVDESIVDRPDLIPEHFESAAAMSFRGKRPSTPEEWWQMIERIKRYEEDE
jgi:transcriptional regulator with XRE-family HTH domain